MIRRAMLLPLVIVMASTSLGCVSIEHAMYRGVVAAEPLNHHCVRSGADIVLSWSRLNHNPLIPFAYAGWAVTLQLSLRDVVPGREFILPTPSVAATLWDIGHHPRAPAKDVRGRIRIVDVTDSYADISVDLVSASKRWAGREEATFHMRTPHPKSCIDA